MEERFVNLERRKECIVGLSLLLVYGLDGLWFILWLTLISMDLYWALTWLSSICILFDLDFQSSTSFLSLPAGSYEFTKTDFKKTGTDPKRLGSETLALGQINNTPEPPPPLKKILHTPLLCPTSYM